MYSLFVLFRNENTFDTCFKVSINIKYFKVAINSQSQTKLNLEVGLEFVSVHLNVSHVRRLKGQQHQSNREPYRADHWASPLLFLLFLLPP